MKVVFLWLCFVIVSLSFIEGHTLKKNKLSQLTESQNKIVTRQKNEKLKKEIFRGKNISCFVVGNSRKVRCSVVKTCSDHDPACRSTKQVLKKSESVDEKKFASTQRFVRSKCPSTKNPFCIHDIWTGKRIPLKSQGKTTVCDPDDEVCLLTIQRQEKLLEMPFESDMAKPKALNKAPEMMAVAYSRSLSPASLLTSACDFIRDPNCRLDVSQERRQTARDELKKLENTRAFTKRQTKITCKGRKPLDYICRWRPQPKKISQDQLSSQTSSSSSSSSNTKNEP